MKIRQAQASDIPALYDMLAALGFYKGAGYFERCLDEQAQGRRQVFIARDGNPEGDIGYGMLNRHPQYALYKRLGIPEIQDLNVVPSARRQGAASALIAHCEQVAMEAGAEYIGISVGLYADYGPAQRLYVKLGYMPDGFGVTYDRQQVRAGEMRPVDDNLCLMLLKPLPAA